MSSPHRFPFLLCCAVIGVLVAFGACGGDTSTVTPKPLATTSASGAVPKDVDFVIATSEVVTGPNRLLVGMRDGQGRAVANARAHLRFYSLDDKGQQQPGPEADTLFLGDGVPTAQALYSVRATFDKAGRWGVDASISRGATAPVTASNQFIVQPVSSAPKIGDPAIPSRNLTLKDAPIEQLTSQRPPGDPDFYKVTIADALKLGRPLMVVFSTPAFCQTQTCGPQLEAAQALKKVYGDRMTFIHIEVYQRPDLLLENKTKPVLNPPVEEWRLQSEPFVFLVDAQGKVYDRFEGFASKTEVEQSVKALLVA